MYVCMLMSAVLPPPPRPCLRGARSPHACAAARPRELSAERPFAYGQRRMRSNVACKIEPITARHFLSRSRRSALFGSGPKPASGRVTKVLSAGAKHVSVRRLAYCARGEFRQKPKRRVTFRASASVFLPTVHPQPWLSSVPPLPSWPLPSPVLLRRLLPRALPLPLPRRLPLPRPLRTPALALPLRRVPARPPAPCARLCSTPRPASTTATRARPLCLPTTVCLPMVYSNRSALADELLHWPVQC